MAVRISFKLGNQRGYARASAEGGLNAFVNGLEDIAMNQVVDAVAVDVHALQTRLNRAVVRSMREAINYARLNIMGTMSSSGSQRSATQIYFELTGREDGQEPLPRSSASYIRMHQAHLRGVDKIEWEPLSTKTRLSKMKSGLSRNDALRHYVHTGSLRKELGGLATAITRTTGTVRVGYIRNKAKNFSTYAARQRVVKVGQLQLTFLPNVPLGYLPGLRSGDVTTTDRLNRFERMLPLSKDAKNKLMGWSPKEDSAPPRQVHRPLLQPITTYWLLTKTPNLVQTAISRSLLGRNA